MITKSIHLTIGVLLVVFSLNFICAQETNSEDNKKRFNRLAFFDYRGTNAIDVAIGMSIINGDIPNPEFGIYFKIGYQRHLTDYLTYNKYNVAFKDVSNEGFMSLGLNLEYLFSPYRKNFHHLSKRVKVTMLQFISKPHPPNYNEFWVSSTLLRTVWTLSSLESIIICFRML